MQWVKPETTPEQLDQDAAQCQQEAWREARFRTWLYRPIGPTMVQDAQSMGLIFPRGQFQMLGKIFRGQPTGMFGGMSGGRNGCERCR